MSFPRSRVEHGPSFRAATLDLDAIRVEEFRADRGLRLEPHSHPAPHFSIVLAGEMSERDGRRSHRLLPGEGRASPAGDEHEIRLGPRGLRCIIVHAEEPAFAGSGPGGPDERVYAGGRRVKALGAGLAAEVGRSDDASPVGIEMLILEVGALFSRAATGRDPRVPPWLSRLRDRLHDAPGSAPTLRELAAEAGVSRAHVARAFRTHFGCTVGERLRAIRVETARGTPAPHRRPARECRVPLGFRRPESHDARGEGASRDHAGASPKAGADGRRRGRSGRRRCPWFARMSRAGRAPARWPPTLPDATPVQDLRAHPSHVPPRDPPYGGFRMKQRVLRRLIAVVTLGSLAGPLVAQEARDPRPFEGIPTTRPVSPAEAADWRADLAQFAADLVANHGNAFHATTPERFAARVAELDARIPGLSRHEIIVALQRIAASIGDGHTVVPFLFDPAAGFHALPIRLGIYAEGLYVEAGAAELSDVVGSRVVALGGVPVDEALARVTPLISRDNDVWVGTMAPLYLMVTEVLHALGLGDDPMAATLTLEDATGARTVRLAARPEPFVIDHGMHDRPEGWIDARDASSAPTPLRFRHPDRPYWREYVPERRALYIKYDQVNDAPHGPGVLDFFAGALAFADRNPVERLILDVRDNSGGEGMLNYGVVKEILRRPAIDRPGGLIVIIGRRTFSAAQDLVHKLDLWTNATFVGEPTGSSPRFWGDHRPFRLERSGLRVSASPTWWQPGGPYDRRDFLPPSLAFEPRWEDYVANRDPAVEAALAWDERVTLEDRVVPLLGAGVGASSEAARAVEAWSADPRHRYTPATRELNALGYRLLRSGRGEDALAVFRLNVAVHPGYANGWDSLGETLLAAGLREQGLEAYRRAYALDPAVGRAAEVLGRVP